jgi:carboxyl-terminal processing protease
MCFTVPRRKLVAFRFLLVLLPFPTEAASSETFDDAKDFPSFFEALGIVQQRSVFIDKKISREKLLQTTLQALLSQQDSYSQFLNPKEYQRFKEYQQESYVGLGMELEKTREGDIFCFPYPDSPAQQAGIKRGDKLLAINGEDIHGKSLFAITELAKGTIGTQVKLTVSTTKDDTKEVIAVLSKTRIDSVTTSWQASIPVIRIANFSSQTKYSLIRNLNNIPPNHAIVLDLRANPGGDFYASLECADLFVPEGRMLASEVSRDKEIPYRSSGIRKFHISNLIIWQDHLTASAAEVFIAALTENDRAVSIGENSYGKGTKQEIIELSDSSALILTTDYLKTPSGIKYNGIGLQPMIRLEGALLKESDYFVEVLKLIK